MALTKTDLLLKEEELAQLTTALTNAGYEDPIGQAAAEAEELFTRYTSRYVIGSNDAKRLQRALIIGQLYALVGSVPQGHSDTMKAAIQELKDIRDGKFPMLEVAEGGKPNDFTGGFGSKPRIC